MLYRRTRAEMPADPDEIAALEQEGVALQELVMPTGVRAAGGRIQAVQCVRMRLSEPDGSGRPRPVPVDGSDFELPCSALLVCVSQQAELSFLSDAGVTLTRWETIAAEDTTGETTAASVFAAGDVVTGPSTVIDAVAAGQRVAAAILQRDGRDAVRAPAGATKAVDDAELWRRRALRVHRPALPERPVEARRDFAEVTPVIGGDTARAEGQRCLLCNEMCNLCVSVCPNRANHEIAVTPVHTSVPVLQVAGEGLEPQGQRAVIVEQRRQIVNLTNLCNECGNCATFCPTAGAPYRDKPRLHLDRSSYHQETDRALYLEGTGPEATLRARVDGEEHWIRREGDGWRYGSPRADVTVDEGFAVVRAAAGPAARAGDRVDLSLALRLRVLLEALAGAPFWLAVEG